LQSNQGRGVLRKGKKREKWCFEKGGTRTSSVFEKQKGKKKTTTQWPGKGEEG